MVQKERITIDNDDVIKVLMQYLHENGYSRSVNTLIRESGVSLNAITSMDKFKSDVLNGNWDSVLHDITVVAVPHDVMGDLFEQIVCELIESNEIASAKTLLRESQPTQRIRSSEPHRYNRMEDLISTALSHVINIQENLGMDVAPLTAGDIYTKGSRETSRRYLWTRIEPLIQECHPSRLMAIIQLAMRWQAHQGSLRAGSLFNLMNFRVEHAAEAIERPMTTKIVDVALGDSKSPAHCAQFLVDGGGVVVGYSDGLLEVRDIEKLAIVPLEYQLDGAFMILESGSTISVIEMGRRNIMFVGDTDGNLSVFDLKTGLCVRQVNRVHVSSVTSITLSGDDMLAVVGGADGSLKIVGTGSGNILRTLDGHTGAITNAYFSTENETVMSISEDSLIRFWNSSTAELINVVQPNLPPRTRLPSDGPGGEEETIANTCTKITAACLISRKGDNLLLAIAVAKFDKIIIAEITLPSKGTVGQFSAIHYITVPQEKKIQSTSDFVTIFKLESSPSGKLLYAQTHEILCFDIEKATRVATISRKLDGDIQFDESEILNFVISPEDVCHSLLVLQKDGRGVMYGEAVE